MALPPDAALSPTEEEIKKYYQDDQRFSEEFNRLLARLRWEETAKENDKSDFMIPYALPDFERAYKKYLESRTSRCAQSSEKVDRHNCVPRVLEEKNLNALVAALYVMPRQS